MKANKYKAMIEASGGFTRDGKRGDRPQPLSKEDESALAKAWKKAAVTRQLSEEKEITRKSRSQKYSKIQN